ncbi:hypothetical protein BDP55DRAFT_108953 [Colletotrichum godetiae]|uniref:Uncharacterized protein n=1 Tax=Colletotrichum godetiae TaxID=1209918 RepID=A0AAJ0ANV1_9PEZI|nr:uncharacterized protein BDP55DRAFT_108953 [Colletotrichum godetiae]KAK1676664.1 hypothetical protein BDP55DRAFT_108953 [Colletotrichum godetiae]
MCCASLPWMDACICAFSIGMASRCGRLSYVALRSIACRYFQQVIVGEDCGNPHEAMGANPTNPTEANRDGQLLDADNEAMQWKFRHGECHWPFTLTYHSLETTP